MAVIELTENESWKEFIKADYCVMDCYGDNCVACVILAPTYDAVADEMGEIRFGRINITQYPAIADAYGINAMPTLLYFRKGELVNQSIGSIEREELLANIAQMLYQ